MLHARRFLLVILALALQTQLEQLGVENMIAKTALSEAQLKQFIKDPPLGKLLCSHRELCVGKLLSCILLDIGAQTVYYCSGVDAILWEQAKKENPDPRK